MYRFLVFYLPIPKTYYRLGSNISRCGPIWLPTKDSRHIGKCLSRDRYPWNAGYSHQSDLFQVGSTEDEWSRSESRRRSSVGWSLDGASPKCRNRRSEAAASRVQIVKTSTGRSRRCRFGQSFHSTYPTDLPVLYIQNLKYHCKAFLVCSKLPRCKKLRSTNVASMQTGLPAFFRDFQLIKTYDV